MKGCNESGCQEKATHRFSSRAGFKVPLCKKHYQEWKEYEFKRSPLMILADIGKWLVRGTGFVMLVFGGLESGFSVLSLAFGWVTSLTIDLSLISLDFHYYTESALNILGIAGMIFLAGIALFYVGFWKMEHDLW